MRGRVAKKGLRLPEAGSVDSTERLSSGRTMARTRLIGIFGTLVATVAALAVLAGSALATPVFLSAQDVSDAGQDAFQPQVAVDASGNSLMVWTRFDGSDNRIQA